MLTTPSGMVISVRPQPPNAESSMLFTPLPIVMPVQPGRKTERSFSDADDPVSDDGVGQTTIIERLVPRYS